MKKHLSITVAALSILIFGCSDDVWTGNGLSASDSNFSDAEGSAIASTGTSSSGHETARHATLSVSGTEFYTGESSAPLSAFAKAADDTELTLTVKSYTQLDEESILNLKAFKFFTLEDNPSFKYGCPVRKTELNSKILDITTTSTAASADTRNVTTVIDFKIDTTDVSTSSIALFADAAILKDIHGKPVLNADQNETCGEETDSLVRYISVTTKKDDTATDTLNFTVGEDFSANLVYDSALDVSVVADSDGNFTPYSGSARYTDNTLSTPDYTYKSDIASELGKIWSLQTMGPGLTAWATTSLSFTYDGDNKVYAGEKVTLEPGTKYRLIKKIPAKKDGLSETTQSELLYGHAAYQSYTNSYTEYKDESCATYFKIEPVYIVTAGTFAKGNYDYDAITAAQKSILTVTPKGSEKYEVRLGAMAGEQLEFDKYEDFIATDSEYNLIPVKVTLKNKTTAIIELENSFYTGSLNLWVGQGTTIKENPSTDSEATSFGIFKDSDYGNASGYVKISSVR